MIHHGDQALWHTRDGNVFHVTFLRWDGDLCWVKLAGATDPYHVPSSELIPKSPLQLDPYDLEDVR